MHIQRGLALALLGVMLAACNIQISSGPVSTPAPATAIAGATPASTTAPAATRAPAATTAPAVTAVPPAATMLPPAVAPIIGFEPKGGGPGTSVNVFGSGYGAGAHVAVRLGLPQPMGEVLASSVVDASGRWSTTLTIPDRLPSGDIITSSDMFLVAMDEGNRALASAPFGFIPPAEPAPNQPASHTPPSEWPGHWVFALESDTNFDGIADIVFYSPAEVTPETTFDDERLANVAAVAAQIRVVQPAADGHATLLEIDPSGARSDIPLFTNELMPTAYLFALDPARGPLVTLLPLGPDGTIYGKLTGIDYDRSAGGFRMAFPIP
jgi:hypothetical protein